MSVSALLWLFVILATACSNDEGESVEADLHAFLARAAAHDPELDAELVMDFFIPATEISPDEPIVRALQEAAGLVLDTPPELAAFPGATDAAHLQGTAGIPTVAGSVGNNGGNGPGGAIYNDGGTYSGISKAASLRLIDSTVSGNRSAT